jgi:hypothetical protein
MPDAGGMQALGRADGGWGAMLSAAVQSSARMKPSAFS